MGDPVQGTSVEESVASSITSCIRHVAGAPAGPIAEPQSEFLSERLVDITLQYPAQVLDALAELLADPSTAQGVYSVIAALRAGLSALADDSATRHAVPPDFQESMQFGMPTVSIIAGMVTDDLTNEYAVLEPDSAAEPDAEPISASAEPTATPEHTRTVHPLIEVAGFEGKPSVVVAGRPFDISVGIGALPERMLARTRIAIPEGAVDLEMLLIFDPASFTIDDKPGVDQSNRVALPVANSADFPTRALTMTALPGENLPQARRIGVQYFHDGTLVGLAWATVLVADDEVGARSTAAPAAPDHSLLDLSVLLQPDRPDLVLTLTRSDDRSVDRYVWSAYSARTDTAVPDGPVREQMLTDEQIRSFTADLRNSVATTGAEAQLYAELAGRAVLIGQRVAEPIAVVVRDLLASVTRAGADGQGFAPTVLLISEELGVPWELADLDLTSPYGGSSPFWGAHVSIGRWPLTTAAPRPALAVSLQVKSGATVSDDFVGVAGPGLGRLPSAPLEADAIARSYPPVTAVPATWEAFESLLEGDPAVDLIHVALHGNFDQGGNNSGLYVISTRTDSRADPPVERRVGTLITPTQVLGWRRTTSPFFFLNACQVGSAKPILGSYSSMAVNLLARGSSGVVAAIWNVDDVVASLVAEQFYDSVFTGGVPAGEALRRIRAGYSKDGARSDPGVTSTLVGYQLFGHPNLRLSRA